MVKITNEVLAEKIDHIHSKLDDMKIQIESVSQETKSNTGYINQMKGAIGIFTAFAGLIGGSIGWVLTKLWGK